MPPEESHAEMVQNSPGTDRECGKELKRTLLCTPPRTTNGCPAEIRTEGQGIPIGKPCRDTKSRMDNSPGENTGRGGAGC
jgi:hypothetical protein